MIRVIWIRTALLFRSRALAPFQGAEILVSPRNGGIASLNHRLIAGKPPARWKTATSQSYSPPTLNLPVLNLPTPQPFNFPQPA